MGTTHLDALQVAGVPTMGVNPLPLGANYWFVNSVTGNDGFSGSYTQPFATTGAAISAATAAIGDVIVWQEGHAETITAAGGITFSKSGVFGIGLGTGANRPTFTFTTSTAATFLLSAANVSISNIVGVCGIDQLVSPFSITAAGCTLGTPTAGGYVEWQDPSSSFQTVRPVLTNASADNLIVNLKVIGVTSGGTAPVNGVRLVGCNSGLINVDFYGRASTAVVEFQGTLCTNIEIYGYMYNASNSASSFAKDVVDTATSSTWFAAFSDGWVGYDLSGGSGSALGPAQAATVIADLAVPSADATTNLLERDVIGNKTDAAVYVAGTTNSLEAYAKGTADLQERVATSATAVLANGTTIFTIAGGPIMILGLVSECVVGGDSAAATVQYAITATGLSQVTISGASGSVANAAAHATVSLIGTALSTAAVYAANGVNLGMSPPGGVVSPVGLIKTVIASGPTTTGTWRHIIRYKPLVTGVTVS